MSEVKNSAGRSRGGDPGQNGGGRRRGTCVKPRASSAGEGGRGLNAAVTAGMSPGPARPASSGASDSVAGLMAQIRPDVTLFVSLRGPRLGLLRCLVPGKGPGLVVVQSHATFDAPSAPGSAGWQGVILKYHAGCFTLSFFTPLNCFLPIPGCKRFLFLCLCVVDFFVCFFKETDQLQRAYCCNSPREFKGNGILTVWETAEILGQPGFEFLSGR